MTPEYKRLVIRIRRPSGPAGGLWASSGVEPLERKDGPEFIPPVVGLINRPTGKGQSVSYDHAAGLVVVGGEGGDVADLMSKRHPLVQPVDKVHCVEVRAPQVVSVLCVGILGAIGAVHYVQQPSGIVAFRICIEDARKREGKLGESSAPGDRRKQRRLHRRLLGIDSCRRLPGGRSVGASE